MWTQAWPSLVLQNLTRSLDELNSMVLTPETGQSDEVKGALAKFLVIRTCGYLEKVSEESCKAYLVSTASPRAAAFGGSWFGHGRNPWPANLVELVDRFDPVWAAELQAIFDEDDDLLKREIAFLVDRRNKMAHGGNEGTGAAKALDLVTYTKVVADWFVIRFDPR